MQSELLLMGHVKLLLDECATQQSHARVGLSALGVLMSSIMKLRPTQHWKQLFSVCVVFSYLQRCG